VAARHQRVRSLQEAQEHIRRARELAEKYGLDVAHPADYIEPIQGTPPDFDRLLDQIK
jgi:hypothetical protein